MTATAIQNKINNQIAEYVKNIKKLYKFDVTMSMDMDGMIIVNFDGQNDNKIECIKIFFSSINFVSAEYDEYLDFTMIGFSLFKGKAV